MQVECQVAVRRAQAFARLSAMLKTLCLVAKGSALPNSEGLPAEFSLTDRLTQVAVGLMSRCTNGTGHTVCLGTVSISGASRLVCNGGPYAIGKSLVDKSAAVT